MLEPSRTLSHRAVGDLVCPSGQTGCCGKLQRSISRGISRPAPAGLRGRAITAEKHQPRHRRGSLCPPGPPQTAMDQADGDRGSLGTAPPNPWPMDSNISGPVCSACLIQLWEDLQLWNNFSEEVPTHELMSLRTNYWVN